MTEAHRLARIILIGLGTYVLVWAVFIAFSVLAHLFSGGPLEWDTVVFSLLNIAFPGLIVYLLFRRADFFAEKVVGAQETTPRAVDWLPFAFRLTAVFAGVLYLHWTVPTIISSIQTCVSLKDLENAPKYPNWENTIAWVIQLGLCIYLLCGAPHFVRWQVKKTIEQCKKVGGTEMG